MKITKLNLNFFKNHDALRIDIDSDIVGIYGLNGKGKTNVLDAIHFLCVGKSYFSGTDIQCIQHEAEAAGIIGIFEAEGTWEVKLVLQRGKRKKIEKNGKALPRVLDHLGQFFSVVIAPGDIELIYGANEKRRSFIDQMLSQTDKTYLQHLVKYKKLIEQRNAVLKSDYIDQALIQALDDQITPAVKYLHSKRQELFQFLIPLIQRFYDQLSKGREEIGVDYISGLNDSSYDELTHQNRRKDLALQRSNSGVHKDEIDFVIDGQALKKYGSQGQIKSFLIALKLAEYQYYVETMKVKPLLLLDDIFEKIDTERALALTEVIKNANFGQIFISDTEQERIEKFCKATEHSYQLEAL
ncbi:DNA replication and repair protein RecF [bacterium]|nr:DNA replication and repair protein RecF [bacterium]